MQYNQHIIDLFRSCLKCFCTTCSKPSLHQLNQLIAMFNVFLSIKNTYGKFKNWLLEILNNF